MDVRIFQGEELRITGVDAAGNEKTIRVSWKSVMLDGQKMMDGLSEEEIAAINDRRKILAIKLCRERTGFGLKEAKDLVDGWVKRNKCCERWPYCEHNESGLDFIKTKKSLVGSLAMGWSYPLRITLDQAKLLMTAAGYNPDNFGIWSLDAQDTTTTWMSNRFSNKG